MALMEFSINKRNKLVGVITNSVQKKFIKNKLNVNSKAVSITQKSS